MDVRVGLWRRLSAEEFMLLNYGVGEDSWESLGLQGDPTSPFWRRAAQSWNSSTWATSCEELTHWKRLWCWEGLRAGGKGNDRGWDGWMASLTRWTWVWVNSGSWWWTGRPGVLRFMGSQRVGHDWATELNWTELVVWICKPTFMHILEPKPVSSCLQQNILLSYSWFSTLNSLYYKSQIVFNFLCHSLVAI